MGNSYLLENILYRELEAEHGFRENSREYPGLGTFHFAEKDGVRVECCPIPPSSTRIDIQVPWESGRLIDDPDFSVYSSGGECYLGVREFSLFVSTREELERVIPDIVRRVERGIVLLKEDQRIMTEYREEMERIRRERHEALLTVLNALFGPEITAVKAIARWISTGTRKLQALTKHGT